MAGSEKIIHLRELLAERFPSEPVCRGGAQVATGIRHFDALLEGGLWQGTVTELTCRPASGGSASVLAGVLRFAAIESRPVALVDGRDSFSPEGPLTHLLWVRCRDAAQALQATDLLVRDGNLGLVILDLRANRDLRGIPSTQWYRLQRATESSPSALLVLTPHPMVPSAQMKFTLDAELPIGALNEQQSELLDRLQIQLARRRFLLGEAFATG